VLVNIVTLKLPPVIHVSETRFSVVPSGRTEPPCEQPVGYRPTIPSAGVRHLILLIDNIRTCTRISEPWTVHSMAQTETSSRCWQYRRRYLIIACHISKCVWRLHRSVSIPPPFWVWSAWRWLLDWSQWRSQSIHRIESKFIESRLNRMKSSPFSGIVDRMLAIGSPAAQGKLLLAPTLVPVI